MECRLAPHPASQMHTQDQSPEGSHGAMAVQWSSRGGDSGWHLVGAVFFTQEGLCGVT